MTVEHTIHAVDDYENMINGHPAKKSSGLSKLAIYFNVKEADKFRKELPQIEKIIFKMAQKQ